MNKINKLPIEIQDIIYNYYWSDIYYQKVVLEIESLKFKFTNMNNFIRANIIPQSSKKYDRNKTEMLILYNKLLENIKTNKGLHLFSSLNIRGYNNNLFNYTYRQRFFSKIPLNLHYILIYCIQLYPHNRNYFAVDFKNLVYL